MNWLLLGGSLAGVLALAGVAHVLKLGGDARLDPAQVAQFARDAGFADADIAIDRAGMSALIRDGTRFLLVRRHGARFVAEPLVAPLAARLDHRFLTIGRTTLDLGEAAGGWAARLRGLMA